VERKTREQFPNLPFFQEPVYNRGRIIGVKGSLLLLDLGGVSHFLILDYLVERKVELKKVDAAIMQTALDKF
jgi:hypothetical protein